MGKINLLDKSIYNMIAAGEVVERPASVVKELVENSIDAGSTSVTVEIKNGGMSYIRVSDNGCGMDKEDLKKAILAHATSKIKTKEDLDKIYTLGFRGEALASISAVSRVEIYSKMKDAPMGNMIAVEGGTITEESEAGCADGTTIIVRNLFFNTPARMKFLKKDSTESAYVTDVVNKIILGNTNISIRYIQGGGKVISSSGDGSLKNAIYAVYGKDYIKHLIDVSYQDDNVKVSGCIGDNLLSKPNRTYQSFFINGRSVVSRIMGQAILESYKNTLMTGKFPFCVLNIEINAHLVDVNVHPTKMEVRFSDDRKIFDAVYWACKNALAQKKVVMDMDIKKPQFHDAPNPREIEQTKINFLKDPYIKDGKEYVKDNKITNPLTTEKVSVSLDTKPSYTMDKKVTKETIPVVTKTNAADDISQDFVMTGSGFVKKNDETSLEIRENIDNLIAGYMSKTSVKKDDNKADVCNNEDLIDVKSKEKDQISVKEQPKEEKPVKVPVGNEDNAGFGYKIIGQVFETYIIVQQGNEMLLIDQHAAHERIYFEELLKDYKEKSIQSQILLMPYTFEFSPGEYSSVIDNIEFFSSVGFDIEPFGINTVIIRKIPVDAGNVSVKELVLEMAEKLSKSKTLNPSDREYDALHTIACKKALKGNRILSTKEMEILYERVKALDNINTCPHGRPIEIKMTKYQIEKQFKRIV